MEQINFYNQEKRKGLNMKKYDSEWFESISDEELSMEREIVRKQWCSYGGDESLALRLEKLLRKFDSELSKRAENKHVDSGVRIHREHGWYLPNDD